MTASGLKTSVPQGPTTRALRRFPFELALSGLIAVAIVVGAEIAARKGLVTLLVLPAPSQIWAALVDGFASGIYLDNTFSTLWSVVVGFLLGTAVAVVLAGILSSLPFLEKVVTPFVVAFQSMPKIAIAPLIIIWFGFGEVSKIIIVLTVCFFPILINTLHGLKVRDRDHYELFKSLGATRWQMFFRLRLPHAVPYIFAGLHIGVIFALIGTVVAEFVGSNSGVGYLMLQAKATFDTPAVYACLLILMLMGMLLHFIMVQIETRVAFWANDITQANV